MHKNDRNASLFAKYVVIFMVVSGYWLVSILTVFVNKKLLSGIDLEAPMFIMWVQTLTTALICFGKKTLSRSFPHRIHFQETKLFDREILKNVLPVSIMFTLMITANNLCLKYVSLAFYNVGRSLTTIFNVMFTYLILGETTCRNSLFFCGLIVFGFFLGVDQENLGGSLSVIGTIFGVLGSLTLSLYSILTKRVFPKLNNDVWLLSYYNNIYAAILFIPLIIYNNEFSTLMSYPKLYEITLWLSLLVGGICGFAIGFFTSLQIKYTSALTHNISGTAKACAQTVLATFWYDESKSVLWWLSNAIVLFGSAGYARVKQLAMEKKHREQGLIYQKL